MLREVADEGCTVFLSSHTLSEVQRVADRVGIIRHGKLVAVERVSELRSKGIRKIELSFSSSVEASVFEALTGTRDVSVEDRLAVLSYEGKIEDLLKVAMDRYDLVDIRTQEADLEEIFLTYYRDEGVAS